MPHPERALYSLQKPDYIGSKEQMDNKLYGDGYKIFKNIYNYFK